MQYKYSLKLILLCLVAVITACGDGNKTNDKQPAAKAVSTDSTMNLPIEIRSVKITTRDGLPDNSIRHIYQDSKGFIWFATLNGLGRYDGTRFVTYRKKAEGMSLQDNMVRDIIEDRNGHLWITTNSNTISCYDMRQACFVDYSGNGGYKDRFKRIMFTDDGEVWLYSWKEGAMHVVFKDGKFTSRRFGKAEFGTDVVYFIYQAGGNNVWIGTENGLYLYADGRLNAIDRTVGYPRCGMYKGERYFINKNKKVFVSAGRKIKEIATIPFEEGEKYTGALVTDDRLMVFTTKGTVCVNMKSGTVNRCTGAWNIPNGEVLTDNKGGLWIKNQTGCLRMLKDGELKEFRMMPESTVGLIDTERYHIVKDSRGLVWITTYGNGLFVYDQKTDETQHFTAGIDTDSPITSNYLQAVMEDRSGCVWVSSEYAGLSQLWVMNKGVKRVFLEQNRLTDRSNAVRMLHKTSTGDIIAGTRMGGLYTYNADMTVMKSKRYFDFNVYAVCEGPDGKTWLGTRDQGLRIGEKTYRADSGQNSLSNNHIFCMLKDRKQRVWIGTFGGGLNLAVPQGDGYRFMTLNTGNANQMIVRCIIEDNNGRIWVGTSGGIIVFNPDELIKNPKAYYAYSADNSTLPADEVRFIMQDRQGRVWLAVPGAGLSCCRVEQNNYSHLEFTTLNQTDGLVDNMVQAMVQDHQGLIWVSTEYGVSVLNPTTKMFDNYLFSQYMMGNVYSENAALLLDNGNILLGSNYGMLVADPSKVGNEQEKISITFTDLKVNGISMHPGDEDSPLEEALSYTDKISLAHNQNSFTIDFSTFNYSGDDAVKYSYMLENFDRQWSQPSTDSYVSYKNLPSGTYLLRVKACNTVGEWSGESVLKIVVRPPFWLSRWAIMLYVAMAVVAGYFVSRTMRNMSRLREKIRFEENLTKYKLVFFTNISHEFRTPLTLIQGSLEKIMKNGNLSDELSYSVKIMDKSTKRMLRLINQLLEFRKMQNNKLSLALEQIDIVPLLRDIFSNFKDEAESKHIDYNFVSEVKSLDVFVDKRHIDKIIYNLLSNAFKYTPTGKSITLTIKHDKPAGKLMITVADTGIGVPEEKREQLFSRFMQSNYSGDSFGIGLHLTHELVTVHKGTIEYHAVPEGGSAFTVTLPTNKEVYDNKDFLVAGNVLLKEETERQHLSAQPLDNDIQDDDMPLPTTPLNKRRVLVVEDDNDVREFVSHELGRYFEVEAVADGRCGLEYATANDVDLIVSDVMMPVMNGYELTRRIKADFATSHIPVILLTALDSQDSVYKGIDSGADAYITKPFSPQLLLRRVFTLIEQRDKLREKFTNDITAARPALCSTDQDKLFADKLTELVNREMVNVNFSVDRCVEAMGIGRTAFFRKVKGITGYTPNEYIRVMRMKKAAEMLLNDTCTVAEVSYKVGIDDPLYFSKCFKKQFGVPPTAYRKSRN